MRNDNNKKMNYMVSVDNINQMIKLTKQMLWMADKWALHFLKN
jgi:hypothetical protein